MYLIFVVRPLTRDIPRAILKPPKVYFYDNGDVIGDEGARFENLVATHLLKKIQFQEDLTGYRYELRYLRDKEGREVDFALLKDGQVVELIEAKLSDKEISSSLTYYSEKLNPNRSLQIVANLKNSYNRGKLQVQSAIESLCSLDEVKIE
jgi:predicted AAA+ superfamily ATPase